MKVLYFIENLGPGGKERRLVELIKKLSQYPDIDIEIVLMKNEIHYSEILDLDVKIHLTERKGIKKDPRVFFKFYSLVNKIKPDVIHVWGNMVAVYAIPTRILRGYQLINSQITDAPENPSIALLGPRITFPFSDKIVANSFAGLKAYNAPSEKSSVIYNGFDFKRLAHLSDPDEIRHRFGITTKHVVGMVATFYYRKDYETYLMGAQMVLEQVPDVTFLCIGDGDDAPYKKMVAKKWRANIRFLGKQTGVESIMNLCDIGVLCTYGEGISNALLEFSALGKPILATDAGGNPEIIENGVNGYLLKLEDSVHLAESVISLLNQPDYRQKLGTAAKDIVRTKFSIEKMITEFYKLYHHK